MEMIRFEAPALFGDHHVLEVRRILLELGGVQDAYVSSAFQVIEVSFDPQKIQAKEIEDRLRQAGYLNELAIVAESQDPEGRKAGDGVFRHTATYEAVKGTVAFAQRVQPGGRALWPCPGFGTIDMEQ
jgi:hypothetical protein